MNGITWIHVAGGMFALLSGAVAVAVRKGDSMRVSAGTWFCVAMFVLGVTASILASFKSPPESPIGGIMVCYFVATAWMAARRRSGTAGRFGKIACAIVLAMAAAIIGRFLGGPRSARTVPRAARRGRPFRPGGSVPPRRPVGLEGSTA